MRISYWSSDVCSSVLVADSATLAGHHWRLASATDADGARIDALFPGDDRVLMLGFADGRVSVSGGCNGQGASYAVGDGGKLEVGQMMSRAEEDTSELQAILRNSYSVFWLENTTD